MDAQYDQRRARTFLSADFWSTTCRRSASRCLPFSSMSRGSTTWPSMPSARGRPEASERADKVQSRSRAATRPMGMKSLELLLALRDKTTTPIAPKISKKLGQDEMSSHNTNWIAMAEACSCYCYKLRVAPSYISTKRWWNQRRNLALKRSSSLFLWREISPNISWEKWPKLPRFPRKNNIQIARFLW